jgi:hypothetical protein
VSAWPTRLTTKRGTHEAGHQLQQDYPPPDRSRLEAAAEAMTDDDREVMRGVIFPFVRLWFFVFLWHVFGWTVLIVLLCMIFGCASYEYPEEIGAPPRPMPPGMTVKVYPIADKTLQGTTTAESVVKLGGRLSARTRVSPSGLECAIEITDAPMSADERDQILVHERRHCAGQQHVYQTIKGTRFLVWQP